MFFVTTDVIDVGYFHMRAGYLGYAAWNFHIGTEYLECGACHKTYEAWNFKILSWLDIAHLPQF